MDKYEFPRTRAKKYKTVQGFKTGDLVKAVVRKEKRSGAYKGRIAVRSLGNFCIQTHEDKVDDIGYKYCKLVQRSDGYRGSFGQTNKGMPRFFLDLKDGVLECAL